MSPIELSLDSACTTKDHISFFDFRQNKCLKKKGQYSNMEEFKAGLRILTNCFLILHRTAPVPWRIALHAAKIIKTYNIRKNSTFHSIKTLDFNKKKLLPPSLSILSVPTKSDVRFRTAQQNLKPESGTPKCTKSHFRIVLGLNDPLL